MTTSASGQVPARPGPKPPKEREDRRSAVEALLVEGRGVMEVAREIGPRFDVSATTIKGDCREVYGRWAEEHKADNDLRRAAAMQRLERLASKAEEAGQFQAATGAIVALGRLAGWIEPTRVTAQATAHAPGPLILDMSPMLPTAMPLPPEPPR